MKRTLNSIGFDIVRMPRSPRHSLLGLRHLPVRSIIDVGANRGQFARRISAIFPEAHIYCFEPLPEPFEELKQWADCQQGKVTVFNMGLGDGEGTVRMFYHLNHSPSSSLLRSTNICEMHYPFTKKQIPVSVTLAPLDKLLEVPYISLLPDIVIKLDVQGYEDRVIRGGIETFRKAKACVLEVCLDPLYEEQATFKNIFILLDELGYRYAGNLDQVYAADGHVIYLDAVFMK